VLQKQELLPLRETQEEVDEQRLILHCEHKRLTVRFGDDPFHTINCTGSDDQTHNYQRAKKYTITNSSTNKPILVKKMPKNTHKNPDRNQ